MRQWLKRIWGLLAKVWFTLPLAATAVLAYGYGLTHEALHIDDLALDQYIQGNVSLSQGRVGSWLIHKALGFNSFQDGTLELVGLILFVFAAAAFCALLQGQAEDRLHAPVYPLFACFLISYPLIANAWVYDSLAVCVGAGYLLTALALALTDVWTRRRGGGYGYAVGGVLVLLLTFTTYESFAAVYVCGVFLMLLLRFLYGAPEDQTIRAVLINGLKFAAVLGIATGLRMLIFPVYGAAPVLWKTLMKQLLIYFVLVGKWYAPIRILLGAAVALLVWGICVGRGRNRPVWLLICGMLASLVVLSVVARAFNGYRTCQVAALFVAGTVLLVAQTILSCSRVRFVRAATVALLGLLCFRQAVNLDHWLHVDVQRYREEVQVLEEVHQAVEETCDPQKPVVFIGQYQLSDAVMRQCAVTKQDPLCRYVFKLLRTDAEWFCYADSTVFSYLRYGLEAFAPGEMLERLMVYRGMVNLHVGTEEMYRQANALGTGMPVWPERGAIAETEAFTIVKLGEIWIPPDREEPAF